MTQRESRLRSNSSFPNKQTSFGFQDQPGRILLQISAFQHLNAAGDWKKNRHDDHLATGYTGTKRLKVAVEFVDRDWFIGIMMYYGIFQW